MWEMCDDFSAHGPNLLELQRLLEISDMLRSVLTFELNSLAHIDSLVWRFNFFTYKQDANNETMFAISVQTQNSCSSSKLLCHKKIQKTFLKLYGPAAGIWNSCGHTDGDGWVPRWSACASFSASLPVGFLLAGSLAGSSDDSSPWIPDTRTGDLRSVPSSRLWSGLALIIASFKEMNQ